MIELKEILKDTYPSVPNYILSGNADFHIFQMPAGEQHINTNNKALDGTYILEITTCSSEDLVQSLIISDAIKRDFGRLFAIIIAYLPGARQDKRQFGEALSCKVYADLLNACNAEHLFIFDPHSSVMPALLNNVHIVKQTTLFSEKFHLHRELFHDIDFLISPDAGAIKKVNELGQLLGKKVICAAKERDPQTGKLTHTVLPSLDQNKKYAVVDDICDGGRTFINLAKLSQVKKENLILFVSHGIFSNGFDELYSHYSKIITTDSFTASHKLISYRLPSDSYYILNLATYLNHLVLKEFVKDTKRQIHELL